MGLIINLHEPVKGDMRVFLGSRQTHMPQKFLDGSHIRTSIQEMSSKGMSQGMGANLRRQTAFSPIPLDNSPNAATG